MVSIATQRTVRSPRCCATSTVRLSGLSLIDGFVMRSAVLISGSPPENSTSTTGPMTWTILPWLRDLPCSWCVLWSFAYPLRASAPPTISISSLVIAAWRARLYCERQLTIISLAFLVAFSIAVMRAPNSEAIDSSRAR